MEESWAVSVDDSIPNLVVKRSGADGIYGRRVVVRPFDKSQGSEQVEGESRPPLGLKSKGP